MTPSHEAPDWLLVIRATWCDGALRREAAQEVDRRGLRLAADNDRHASILHKALAE